MHCAAIVGFLLEATIETCPKQKRIVQRRCISETLETRSSSSGWTRLLTLQASLYVKSHCLALVHTSHGHSCTLVSSLIFVFFLEAVPHHVVVNLLSYWQQRRVILSSWNKINVVPPSPFSSNTSHQWCRGD